MLSNVLWVYLFIGDHLSPEPPILGRTNGLERRLRDKVVDYYE